MLDKTLLIFFFIFFCNNFLENFALKRQVRASACELISNKPLPYSTPAPTNVITKKAVFVHTFSPVVNQNGIFAPFQIINTGYALEYRANPPPTSTRTYGGVMCNITYIFHNIAFFQTKNLKGRSYGLLNGEGTSLTLVQYYFKKEYGTFENALKYRDGLVIQAYPLAFTLHDNPLFYPVEIAIRLIRKAGSYVYLPAALAYLWFDKLPELSKYYAYYTSYKDPKTGKEYECAIAIIPDRAVEVISEDQFIRSFLQLLDVNDETLDNAPPIQEFGKRTLLTSYGLVQFPVPF